MNELLSGMFLHRCSGQLGTVLLGQVVHDINFDYECQIPFAVELC